MSNNELYEHKRSDTVKWVLTLFAFILVGVMLAGIILGWFDKKDESPAEEQQQTEEGSELVVNDGINGGISLMSEKISPADFEAYGVSPLAESAQTVTATIQPSDALNKAVDWSVAWANASSAWADGKTVTDYVTVTPTSDGAAGVTAGEASKGWSYTDEVAFPFGYGGSYTTFSYSDYTVEQNGDGDYEVSVTVSNSGDVKGKEVVQVYIQKPYTEYDKQNHIEKSSVELVGFAKTEELEPGAEQTVTITVPAYEFKTYDAYGKGTYIVEEGEHYLAVGSNSHDALNNILANKGYTVDDGMDYNGNDELAVKIDDVNIAEDEFSVSPFTQNPVSNRFDDADVNRYEGTKGQEITYLSRSDWNGTYPQPVVLTCSEQMIEDLQYGPAPEPAEEGVEAPIYGEVTSELGQLTLAMLMDVEYDDPLWEDLLNQLTLDESLTLVTAGSASFAGAESVAAPGGKSHDGPCGIRDGAILESYMAFHCNGLLAATWNEPLIEELGNAFGMEIMHIGFTGIYGTGADIHRNAYSGRSWEYYSEDGFLSGKAYAAEVRGLQNRGVITFTKHFALNEQERNRYGGSVWANEQSIREIYLKAFEAGVTEGNANAMMSSFNRIGCTWAGSHKGLLTDVLRGEWGFIGMVETDAGVATALSNLISFAFLLGVFLYGRKQSTMSLSLRRFSLRYAGQVPSVGLSAAFTTLLANVVFMIINILSYGYGTQAVSAYGIVKRLDQIPLGISLGLSQGVMPLIAYNYGSGDYARLKKVSVFSWILAAAMAAVCVVLFETLAPYIARLMLDDEDTVPLTTNFLRIACTAVPFTSVNALVMYFFQTMGKGAQATVLAVCRQGALNIPFLFLMNWLVGLYGMIWVQLIIELIMLPFMLGMYLYTMKKLGKKPAKSGELY